MAVNKKGLAKAAARKVVSRVVKRAGPIGVASTLYGFYKEGQKRSGGKVRKNQKSFMKNAKKKSKSIIRKKNKKK